MFSKYSSPECYTIFIICVVNFIVHAENTITLRLANELRMYFNAPPGFKMRMNGAQIFPQIMGAPIFGYLGDRRSRKRIMFVTVFLCTFGSLLSTFITEGAWKYLFARGLVGACNAGFVTVAPSVLADLVRDDALSVSFTYFNLTFVFGSILAGLIKEMVMKHIKKWWYCSYILALLVFVSAVGLLYGVDPDRGYKDVEEEFGKGRIMKATSYKKDLKRVFGCKTFLFTTAGVTFNYFFTGIIRWYGPELLNLGYEIISEREKKERVVHVSTIFASMFLISGLIGVQLGSYWSRLLRRVILNIDPLICGLSLLLSVPFMGMAILTASIRTWEAFYYLFFGQILTNLMWAIAYYVLQFCAIPTRRCTARAWLVVASRLIGDFIGPVFIQRARKIFYRLYGLSEVEIGMDIYDIENSEFRTLQSSLAVASFFIFIAGVFFLWNAKSFTEECQKVKDEIRVIVQKEIDEEEAKNTTQNITT